MKFLLTIFLMMSLVACSGSKLADRAGDALEDAGSEFAEDAEDSLEKAEDDLADQVGLGDDEEEEEKVADDDVDSDDVDSDDESEDVVDEDISVDGDDDTDVADSSPAPSMEMTGSNGVYNVQAGDTLMLIAFKIYGDYDMWRKLARLNSGKLGPNYSVSVNMSLTYDEPANKFEWNPSGNPYLIRSGDTLGTISRDTYGSMGYWKNIWNNNRPLIKDPNRIFAGFTIYTPVIDGRGVANEDS